MSRSPRGASSITADSAARMSAHHTIRLRAHRRGIALAAWWLLCLLVPMQAQAQRFDLVLPPLGFERIPWREVRVPPLRQWLTRAGISLREFEPEDRDRFHVVDIDADGLPDIVFDGGHGAGAEGIETRIYRNAGTRFELAAYADAEIYAIGRHPPGQTPSLVLDDHPFGMCEVSDRRLRFLRRSSPPNTALYQQFDEVRYLDLPDSRWPRAALPSPIRVRVAQDQYRLRAAPALDDSTEHGDCEEHHGNTLAAFRLGSTAWALAQLRVGTRLWYFVMTDPGSVLTEPGADQSVTSQARLIGWMSARFLEAIPPATAPQPSTRPGG